MAALPYMQLYVADYLADTAHLTTEEHGAYLLLLFSYWQTGKPLRENRLASVARMSNERWANAEQVLSDFFDVQNGLWTHFRVEADLEKVCSKSKTNSEAGKASARARALAKQQAEESKLTSVATTVEQTYQRNVNHTDTDTDKDTEQIQDQKLLSPEKKKPKKEKPVFELPEWIDQGAWDGFIEMRKAIKKPLTDSGKKLAVDKLQKLGREGHSPKEVLNQSTLSSWQGLFAIKEEFRNGQNANTSGPVSAVGRVAAKAAERERARQGAAPQYYEQGDFIEGEFAPG